MNGRSPKAPQLLFGMDPKSISSKGATVSVKIADVARRCHISRQAVAKWGVTATDRGMIDALEAIEVLHLQAKNARESEPAQRKSADRIEDAKADIIEAKRDKLLLGLVEADRLIDVVVSIVGAAVYELQQIPADLVKGQIVDRAQADEINKRLERSLTKITNADWRGELRFADADFAALDLTEEADPDFPGFESDGSEEESD